MDFDAIEDRADVSTFDVPRETIGFLLGKSGITLRGMENKYSVFMFLDNDRQREGKHGPCKRLYVVGNGNDREAALDEAEEIVRFKLTGQSSGRGGPPRGPPPGAATGPRRRRPPAAAHGTTTAARRRGTTSARPAAPRYGRWAPTTTIRPRAAAAHGYDRRGAAAARPAIMSGAAPAPATTTATTTPRPPPPRYDDDTTAGLRPTTYDDRRPPAGRSVPTGLHPRERARALPHPAPRDMGSERRPGDRPAPDDRRRDYSSATTPTTTSSATTTPLMEVELYETSPDLFLDGLTTTTTASTDAAPTL